MRGVSRAAGRLALVTVAALAVSLVPARAGTVFFTDGRGLEIDHAWIDADGLLRLRLPQGGEIGTDPKRVARVLIPLSDREIAAEAVPEDLESLADLTARRYGLDERLVRAVVQAESGFDPGARSPVGAMGLMQLMPGTASDMQVQDAFDPAQNLDGGVRYLRWMLDRFEGDLDLALAAYNAGPEAVRRYGGIPPFRETRDYVARVRSLAKR